MDPIQRMYLNRDERERQKIRDYKKPPARFRASELADCKRKIWYRHSGYVPAPRTGFSDDWSIDGDVHHDVVRQIMLEFGIQLCGITQHESGSTEEDGFVAHDFDVDGRTITVSTRQDGWIWHEDYGWMLLEIKSQGHWVYHYVNKAYTDGWKDDAGVEYPAGPKAAVAYLMEKKPEYLAQVMAGIAIARAQGSAPTPDGEPLDLDHAYLVIKDRGNCHIGLGTGDGDLQGLVIPYDQDILDKALRRAYVVKGKVLDGQPPMAEFTAGSKQCGYCPYRYACHDADKRRKQGLDPVLVYPDPACGIEFLSADEEG
jgi:CRISPR/Cas system-associated exonuclease Cas4 (RecB family)